MKVLLVAINSKYIHSNLAVRYLKAYTEDLNYEGVIKEFSINEIREEILERIIKESPQVVAFSTYIWNVNYVRELSNLIKLVDEKIEIIYGGPEVSYDSKEFLGSVPGDYVIEGEGEESFKEFIEYKLGLRDIEGIRGLYYKRGSLREHSEIAYNGPRPLMDMNNIAFPYKEEEDLTNKIAYYEGSRGCPFNCKYCLSSTIHGVRFLDIERVKRELKFLIDKKVRLVKFVDRTFNCNSNFSIGVWKFLIEQDTDTTFHFEISADILKNQELELLKTAPKGRFQFEVGVQTTNDVVLRNINRYVNFKDIKEKIEELQKIKNIKQHLDLIAGLPGEGLESFIRSFNDVYSIGPEEIQLGFLKLLKGSSMREEAEKWGMKYSPYAPYEILSTNSISYEELVLLKKIEAMVDKYYNSQKFNAIIRFFMDKFPSPYEFFHALAGYFSYKGYFERNISNNEYYKIFLDFNQEVLKAENEDLKEIIRYEYLKFNKKRGMPEFLHNNVEKDVESILRNYLKDKYMKEASQYFIEEFQIDILKFERENIIHKVKSYIVFSVKNEEMVEDATKNIILQQH